MKISEAAIDRSCAGIRLSPTEARSVLEVTCLAVATDGALASEEITVLHGLARRLGIDLTALGALVEEVASLETRDERLARLRTAGDALASENARHLAYAMSVLTMLADEDEADAEFEFDFDLQDALHVSPQTAERLADDVRASLAG